MIRAHYEEGRAEGVLYGTVLGFLSWMLIYLVAGWVS